MHETRPGPRLTSLRRDTRLRIQSMPNQMIVDPLPGLMPDIDDLANSVLKGDVSFERDNESKGFEAGKDRALRQA